MGSLAKLRATRNSYRECLTLREKPASGKEGDPFLIRVRMWDIALLMEDGPHTNCSFGMHRPHIWVMFGVDALLVVCYAMANPDAEESPVRPVIVMPLHDPQGYVLSHLYRVTPSLEQAFAAGYASLTCETQLQQPTWIERLVATGFYRLSVQPAEAPLGERFRALYREAAAQCDRQQPLHLCFADRVAFALQDVHREAFLDDTRASGAGPLPLLFQRSAHAWQTHPRNYREVEHMATRAGALLTGRSLDWTWCHLVVRAGQLDAVLPALAQQEISVLGELLLALLRARNGICTRDVDWLAWEDPFILGQADDELRQAREGSVAETRKRLAYVIPTMALLLSSTGAIDRAPGRAGLGPRPGT